MRSADRASRLVACVAAVAAATTLTGCVSTQTKNARTVLVNQRALDSESSVRVTRSNPDVSVQATLQQYTDSTLLQGYASEMYLSGLTVRGDLPPYFGSYGIGDDLVFEADDYIWPDQPDGRTVALASRIMGWTCTPPEGANSEKIQLTVSGGDVSSG